MSRIIEKWRGILSHLGKGEIGAAGIDTAIELVLLVVVIGAVAGTALGTIADVDTTSWEAGAVALWGVIGTFVVVGFVYLIWRSVKSSS